MESRKVKHFFPILSGDEFYPITLGIILSAFYTSNKKELTIKELQYKTNLTNYEIVSGLQFLRSLGEVTKNSKNTLTLAHFAFNAQGSLENLKTNIKKSRDLLHVLEQILDSRDNTNQALNNFIKETLVFYSEVLDFMELKAGEHFNTKKLS